MSLRSRILQVTSVLLIVAFAAVGWSLAQTMRVMPNTPVSVQVAEWARTHGLGFLVTEYELMIDALHAPKAGGRPDPMVLLALANSGSAVGARAPMPTPLTPSLPDEGSFRVLRSLHGVPVIQEALVRPDARSSSYLTSVIVMSAAHTRLTLHPGTMDPGNPRAFHSQAYVSDRASSRLLATFNSGFLVQDSLGGFSLNGRTVGRLREGAASIVTYKDGHTALGMWGRDVSLTSDVVSVRQNLRLIVDRGRPVPKIAEAVSSRFGAAAGASFRTWRTGLGITATGDLVYAMGDALTTNALADVLAKAGAVRAMQLDINYHSVVYLWYTTGRHGHVLPHKILNPAHGVMTYLSVDPRDFFALYAR
jgi:hypothetical protein